MADVGTAARGANNEPGGPVGSGDVVEIASESVPFPELYRNKAAFVWRALRRLGVRAADVEDACQDVFVVVHSKLELFDWNRSLEAWLLGISVKVAAKYRRKAHVRREKLTDLTEVARSEAEGATALERKQAKMILENILDNLPERQREAFVLFELQELPMAVVAELTDAPLQTAYSRLYAARKSVDAQIRRFRATPEKGAGHES